MSTNSSKSLQRAFPWREPFLSALRQTGKVVEACKATGISRNSVYTHCRRYPRFRKKWERALDAAWEARSREGRKSMMADLERRNWFARNYTSKREFEQRAREIEGRLRTTI